MKQSEDLGIPDILKEIVHRNRETPTAVIRNLIICEANDACARLLGARDREQLRGMNGTMLVTKKNVTTAKAVFERLGKCELLGGSHVCDMIRLDGHPIRVMISAISWPTDPSTILAVGRDVTEREHSIDKLRNSEKLYRTVAEALPAAVIMRDNSGEVTFANEYAAQLTGYSREELMQAPLKILTEDGTTMSVSDAALRDGIIVRGQETRLTRKDGRKLWVSVSSQPIRDEDGVVQGVCSTILDITDGKTVEQELRKGTEGLSTLLQSFPDPYFQLDHDCVVLDCYAGSGAESSVSPEKFLGKRIDDLLPKDVAAIIRDAVRQVLETGEMTTVEYDLTMGKRKLKEQARLSPSGSGVVCVIQNITEQKQAERALQQALKEVERAYALQQEFLNSVTHEVRTPLTSVMGYTTMLLEGIAGPLNKQQESMLLKTMSATETLLRMMDSMLQAARLKSGMAQLTTKRSTPTWIAKKAVDTMFPQAAAKDIFIEYIGPTDKTPGTYDPDKVRAIVFNLLSNAIKFTTTGGVQVIASADESGSEIIIVDSGIGIPENDIPSIFDEFYQVKQPKKSKAVGFGLGLSIVARMVDAIHGTLIVSSRKGIGTAFTLYMPVLDDVDL